MAEDLVGGDSFLRVVKEHSCDKVFELFGVEAFGFSSAVDFPELLWFFQEHLVVGIFLCGLSKWRVTGLHDKKNNPSCKQIN